MKKKSKKKRKFTKFFRKVLVLLFFILIIFLFGTLIYYLFEDNIHNIYINGNKYISEQEILELAKLDTYPGFFTTISPKIEKSNYNQKPIL